MILTATPPARQFAGSAADFESPDSRAVSQPSQHVSGPHINLSPAERKVSVAAGAVLAMLGLGRGGIVGWSIAGVGVAAILRGATGYSPVYQSLGIDTHRDPQSSHNNVDGGIRVSEAMLIGKPADELYNFWRKFDNLPQFMFYLKSVTVHDDRHSRWVATAPKIAGGEVAWEAEITTDVPNEQIAWRSLPGSEIDCKGEIRFSKALGDRGTNVSVFMEYTPPAGRIGHWVATLFGESPERQIREGLRNFRQLMETGEIPTVKGQSRGTCTGRGKRDQSA